MKSRAVDSIFVRPVIIALGRGDNHAFVGAHARSLGVEYLAVEGFEASELIASRDALRTRFAPHIQGRAPILAAIDSSIAPATLRSFCSALDSALAISTLLRTDLHSLDPRTPIDLDFASGLLALSIARSPHGQVSIWPILHIESDGSARPLITGEVDIDALTLQLTNEVGQRGIIGVMTFFIDPSSKEVVSEEFGLAKVTIWSESASYTAISEQIVRAILDLPLGDCRLIDFEEFYLREEIELPEGAISDPIRPFLHLFARNPRLKVSYPAFDDWSQCAVSLFASSEAEVLSEMAHAREFMLGND